MDQFPQHLTSIPGVGPVTAAAIYDPELKAFCHAKRQEGKHHNTAIGAVCRKLLARIFIILKEQRPYIIRGC